MERLKEGGAGKTRKRWLRRLLEGPRPCAILCFALINYAWMTWPKCCCWLLSQSEKKTTKGWSANKNIKQRNLSGFNTMAQSRCIKIQPNTTDLGTRLWGINPTNSVVVRASAEIYCFRLNFNISKLGYYVTFYICYLVSHARAMGIQMIILRVELIGIV